MPGHHIEPITRRHSEQRQKLHDRWKEYFEQLDEMLKTKNFENLSPIQNKSKLIADHLFQQHHKTSHQAHTNFLNDHAITNLTKAYEPDWKQKLMVALQIIGHVAGGVLGIVPAVSGATGSAAAGFSSASQAVSGALGGGAQSVGSIFHGVQQGKQAELSNKMERVKQLASQDEHDKQLKLQARNRQIDEEMRREQTEREAKRSVLS